MRRLDYQMSVVAHERVMHHPEVSAVIRSPQRALKLPHKPATPE